jgi:hypothetical protein
MSDTRDDGKTTGGGPEAAPPRSDGHRPAGPLTRRDAFRRLASNVMGGVALAVGGPLVASKAHGAAYYSRYSSSYYSRYYSQYSSRYYSQYSSRYNSRYYSQYSSRYYSQYSSRYNSISRQQEWRRQDVYRSQQNQVVKDSIRKQIESEKRFRYQSNAMYYSRAATYSSRYFSTSYSSRSTYTSRYFSTGGYTSRYISTGYTSRLPYASRYFSTAYASRGGTAYTSRAPLGYTSRAPLSYASRAGTPYTSRATPYTSRAAVPDHKAPVRPDQKIQPKGKTPYSSWYCSQGLWHRYSSLA